MVNEGEGPLYIETEVMLKWQPQRRRDMPYVNRSVKIARTNERRALLH